MSGFASVVFFLLTVLVMVIGVLIIATRQHADALRYGVPWLRWLTLDEIVELGHSRRWAVFLLPLFHRKDMVEIRISGQASEADRAYAERRGLYSGTAEFYEYRFTENWRRGKQKKILLRLPAFGPTPVYNSPLGEFSF